MRTSISRIMMALSVLMVLSIGLAFAQTNATETNAAETNATVANITQANITETKEAPTSSQLSNRTSQQTEVLGKSTPTGYTDVTKLTSDVSSVFSTNPSVGVSIVNVDTAEKWVQVTNEEVAGSRDLTGWKLVSGGSTTFTFPELTLDSGSSVKIHEGPGASTKTDFYTDSTEPLWTGNEISLVDAAGSIVSTYTIPAVQAPAKYVNPLSRLIDY